MFWEFDPAKASSNYEKHGVRFDEIEWADWERAVVRTDNRRDYGEERRVAFVPIGDRLHVGVFVPREGGNRLVSLRKANRREVRLWEEALG